MKPDELEALLRKAYEEGYTSGYDCGEYGYAYDPDGEWEYNSIRRRLEQWAKALAGQENEEEE